MKSKERDKSILEYVQCMRKREREGEREKEYYDIMILLKLVTCKTKHLTGYHLVTVCCY